MLVRGDAAGDLRDTDRAMKMNGSSAERRARAARAVRPAARVTRAALLAVALLPASAAAKVPGPVDIGDAESWIKARARTAKKGKPELVRIPVAYRSMGWGCRCPDNYIGTGTDAAEGPWIKLVGSAGPPYDYSERLGTVVVAEGYFTGRRVEEDLRDGPDSPKEWLYKLWEFKVVRMRRFRDARAADAKLHVLLDGASAARKVAPLGDDKRWLVIVDSVRLTDKRSARRAARVKKRLIAKGFSSAQVFDSRAAWRLFCCYRVVVAGRYATKKQARAVARRARARRFRGVYVKQGW